jgi:hypothetical protein
LKLEIILPWENFRGMSYGDWIAAWYQWLLSERPEYNGEDILFLRGNVNYRPVGGNEGGPQHIDPKGKHEGSEEIDECTAILIPILTSHLSLGDYYNGKKITSIPDLRETTNKDTNGGSIWATIEKKGGKAMSIVSDLKDYRFESPLFFLLIPRNSKLRKQMDIIPKPGNYHTIIVGYFIIIKSLPMGTYRLKFGGTNGSAYHTNSLYDIKVIKKRKDNVIDKSDHNNNN